MSGHLTFEWDEAKAASNLKKHRVSFEMAARVFLDPLARSEQDRIVQGERRWQTIGLVEGCLLVLVAHTVLHEGQVEVIRIISARQADKQERKRYEENG